MGIFTYKHFIKKDLFYFLTNLERNQVATIVTQAKRSEVVLQIQIQK